MRKITIICLLIIYTLVNAQEQKRNTGNFVEPKSTYWNEVVQKNIDEFNKKEKIKDLNFKVNFSGMILPKSKEEFKYFWHNDPINQGLTGTCWSFSTTSFFESEIFRIHKKKIRISPLYNAYCEYLEKAKRYVDERGNSYFGEGSEANAIKRLWPKFGCIPFEVYSGLLKDQKSYDHSKMFDEMNAFLVSVKQTNAWNDKSVLETIRSILNKYMGVPPEKFEFEGKNYTPVEFFQKVVDLNMEDYFDIISLKQSPYWEKCKYNVPDNWWHDKSYNNIPLNEYIDIIKKAIRKGFTIVIGGDVSEPGFDSNVKAAIVPTFDIPSEYIDEDARQLRFSNTTTQDDHGIHLIGYKNVDGKDWFLIKDSGAGAFNVDDKGYFFYHEDYVKLKIVDFMIHKDAIQEILGNLKK